MIFSFSQPACLTMRKRSIFPCLLLVACILPLCNIVHCAETDGQRLAQLKALQKSTRSGLIPMSIDTFQRFVESAPRTYGIIVMFSAPPNLCHPCIAMTKQVSQVSTEYYKLPSNRLAPKPLFFAQVKLAQTDQMFLSQYQIRHVPVLYYFPPERTRSYPQPLHEQSPNYYPVQQLGIGANSIRHFINVRTHSRLRTLRGNYQIPFVETVKNFKPLILLIVAIFAAFVVITGTYKSPMLWFGLVVLVYIFSVGGGHYSWIHNVPLAVVNKEGRTEYVASGSRSQYVAEGFFVSVTCVSISALVIIIQELPKVMPNKTGQTFAGIGLFCMTLVAIVALLAMYDLKMPQYMTYNELS